MGMVKIRKLHPLFGAEILSFRPGEVPGAEVLSTLEQFGVVLLRDQVMTDDEFLAFAKSMGTIWTFDLGSYGNNANNETRARVYRHSNLHEDGKLVGVEHQAVRIARSTELWHTDATYAKPGATTSMLLARQVPPVGGNTEFCDSRIAYESLDVATQQRLADLWAHHSVYEAFARTGTDLENAAEQGQKHPNIRRPLVRTHRPSGRRALCIPSHIRRIEGMSREAGERLLDELVAIASTPQRVYVHQWRPGDLLIWDNRCTMHRARPYDYGTHPRDMRTLRLMDPADDESEIATLIDRGHSAADRSQRC
jgi:alpha-ketoglutarate-dependent 2,4-dichlorophenoxyacetate dioxygenase